MVFSKPVISATFKARLSNGQPMGLGSVIRFLAERVLIGTIGAVMLAPFVARSANAANDFELKISGYFNLTPGGALHGASGQTGSSVGVVPEGEIELTPQYHLDEGGTILAARFAINASADVGQSFQNGDLSIPEVSAFVIGKYGRFEVGERAAFPKVSSALLHLRSRSRPPSSAPNQEPGSIPTGDYRQHSCRTASQAASTLSLIWGIRSASTMSGHRSSFTSLHGFMGSMRQYRTVREPYDRRVSRSLTRQPHLARRATRSPTLRIRTPSTVWCKRPSCTTDVRRT
jgi:hypothetical protein